MSFFKGRKREEHRMDLSRIGRKVPILLNYEPFKKVIRHGASTQIKKEMKLLSEMVEEEKKHILEVNSLHKEKSRITASILYLSNQLNQKNNRSSEQELEMRKNRMKEIIEDIRRREAAIQELRLRQEEQNLVLLGETVEYAYEKMKKDEKDLDILLKEIEKLREKLRVDREKRDHLKSRLDSLYGFMHALMGAKETEKLDLEFFEDEEL